jgi:heme/copper-type cytochrome/quinol oxidase subunit 2
MSLDGGLCPANVEQTISATSKKLTMMNIIFIIFPITVLYVLSIPTLKIINPAATYT